MPSVWRCSSNTSHVHEERFLKETPDVMRVVDFFHLHLRVNVAVVQEIDVGLLDLQQDKTTE